jgi:NAD(P)-dependent dehydrogenase (short-subunit alcohol dehydrogenase family)
MGAERLFSADWTPEASDRIALADRQFAGQVALITGAGRGIGRAIALHLARAGADVCLAARTRSDLEQVADEAEREGARVLTVPCDLTDPEQATSLVETAAEKLHCINMLINNAGGAHRVSPLDELQATTFATGTALNYTAVYRTMHAAAPYLFAAVPRASVLNVVSIAAARGLEGLSYYSGAKSAVLGLSRAAAREWGKHGVRVNCLGPGWIATDLSQPLRDDPKFSERTLEQIPLGRWGSVDEVAEAAVFLVSDAARYITGTTLYVDGGLLA